MKIIGKIALSGLLTLLPAGTALADEQQPSEQCESGELEAGFVAGEANVTTHCIENASAPVMDEIVIPETPEMATESAQEDPFGNG